MAKIYDDYDEAARASQHRKAISAETFTVDTPKNRRRLRIVKPLGGDPFAVFSNVNSLRCNEWDPSYAFVSAITEWEAF